MQYSRDKYFPQLITKVSNLDPVEELRNTLLAAPAHKQQILATQREQGLSIPQRLRARLNCVVIDR